MMHQKGMQKNQCCACFARTNNIWTDQTTLIASSFFYLPKLNGKWNESLEDGYPDYLKLRAWRQQQ